MPVSWTVPGTVERIIDGDTAVVTLDLGWRVYRMGERLRISGLNSPERGTQEGRDAREAARQLLPVGARVTVTSEAKPSFERTVGSITLADGRDFADAMVSLGHGVRTT